METTEDPASLTTYLTETSTVDITLTRIKFSWYDYTLFSTMLGLSVLIGIYFGCFGSKQSTTNEYLLGGKKMKVIPIALSLVASHVSGVTLLAVPADVYKFGANYWWICATMIIVCLVTSYVFLPIFFNLGITSTYEYLERRFDYKIRMIASLLFALSVFLHLPIVIYIPALAFSAATGINVHLITPTVCCVCIFYTTIGGLKAVVWTDSLQFTVTLGAMVSVFVLGLITAGGFSNVWAKSLEGDRLDMFDFDLDPTKRDTFWIVVIGFTISWIAHSSINQGCVQKFLSVASLKDAYMSVALFGFGIILVKTICVVTGLIMFAIYADCDPFSTGHVQRNDQLLPYYVLHVAGKIPGLPGLFIAGVFSAALSTLSASLNCLAGTIYEDFISKFLPETTTQKTASNILKTIVVVTGVICTALVFVIEHLGGLLPLAISFTSVTAGPSLGLFVMGALFPRANTKGALWGTIAGLLFLSWIIFTAQYYKAKGVLNYPSKPLSTEGCTFSFNSTITDNTISPNPENLPFMLFRVSYYYYTIIGGIVTTVVGMMVSLLTAKNDPPVSREVLSPVIHFLLPKEHKPTPPPTYYSVEKALHIVTYNNEKVIDEKQ